MSGGSLVRCAAVALGIASLWSLSVASAQPGGQAIDALGSGLAGGAAGPIVTMSAQFTGPSADGASRLFVTARIQSGWHVYSITQAAGGPVRSQIKLDKTDSFQRLGEFQPSTPPEKKTEPVFNNLLVETHHGTVTWHAPIRLAAGANPQVLKIAGQFFAQPCDADTCLPPQDFPFTAVLGPGVQLPAEKPAAKPETKPAATAEGPAPTGTAAEEPSKPAPRPGGSSTLPWVRVTTFDELNHVVKKRIDLGLLERNAETAERGDGTDPSGFLWLVTQLLLAFGGGLLLNIMPCVLPVIGLKILSFVNQAGHDRGRALALNVAFSAGLISVFLVLATAAAMFQLQWGAQFQYPGFNVAMAAIVFAMAISFLGVWEIPIPGFVGRGKATELAAKEGIGGAFAKGIITTLLATPCTAPGMASAVSLVVREPPAVIYAIFLAIGLGMASPYLLIGVFPQLVRFLPKPGAWMETFKQVMGFVLLATTVWILSFTHWPYVLPTVGLLFALWAGLWWVERSPVTEPGRRGWAWVEAIMFCTLMSVLLFPGIGRLPGLYDVMNERWQTATAGAGRVLPSGRYTLLIDFTADWCVNCKTYEAAVLNTKPVREFVDQNQIVPVTFDLTVAPADKDTQQLLKALRSGQVPTIVVLPADDPNQVTKIFRGGYTQDSILDALQKAGPSLDRWNAG
jgi:suppressor for copper-sensitivity B